MNERIQVIATVLGITLAIIYVGSAIAKLAMYSKWSGEGCSVEMRLHTYMLYCGLVHIGWIVLCIIALCCGFDPTTYLVTRTTTRGGRTISEETKEEEHGGYGGIILLAVVGCLLASIVFTGLGNAWILNKYKDVVFSESTTSDYGYAPLFKGGLSMVIISDIWYGFFIIEIILVIAMNASW